LRLFPARLCVLPLFIILLPPLRTELSRRSGDVVSTFRVSTVVTFVLVFSFV
jgi:hypothetical protein